MENNKQDNNSSQRSNEEEIDLGQLFTLIGKGFSNLFNAIGKFFSAIFNFVITLILIAKKNIIFISISTAIGLSLGIVYQNYVYVPKYESIMNVKPNFGATIQLYKNINYYQNLLSLKDYKRLSKTLGITEDEASNLKRFTVEPYANKNQSIKAYGRFLSSLDTTVTNRIELDEFIDNQPVESFEFHIIKVLSKDRYIFSKLEAPIIKDIEENHYFKATKASSISNLINEKKSIESSIVELDTLRKLNREIMIKESEKEAGSGTNIFISSKTKDNTVSYEDYKLLNEDLSKVNETIESSKNIISVVSEFDTVGAKEKKWYKNFYFLGFFVGFLFSFGYVYFMSLYSKLGELEEKRKNR